MHSTILSLQARVSTSQAEAAALLALSQATSSRCQNSSDAEHLNRASRALSKDAHAHSSSADFLSFSKSKGLYFCPSP